MIALIVVVLLASMADMAEAASTAHDHDPTPELLEFLGTWQTPDGTVISPFDLEDDVDDPSRGPSNPIPPRSSDQPTHNPLRPDSSV